MNRFLHHHHTRNSFLRFLVTNIAEDCWCARLSPLSLVRILPRCILLLHRSGTPPPALLVNALISCIALTGIALGGPLLDTVMPAPSSLERNQENDKEEDPNAPVKAGLELGMWKGLGTTANVFGLSMTTANHAAFLIQLTTLLVPVIQSFMGYEMSKKIWLSVGLALSGVFLFTQEATVAGAASNQALGDALCLVAAVFYAGYDIRCFEWGKQVPARELITNKIATQAGLSLLLLVGAGWDQANEFFNILFFRIRHYVCKRPVQLVLVGGLHPLEWSYSQFTCSVCASECPTSNRTNQGTNDLRLAANVGGTFEFLLFG